MPRISWTALVTSRWIAAPVLTISTPWDSTTYRSRRTRFADTLRRTPLVPSRRRRPSTLRDGTAPIAATPGTVDAVMFTTVARTAGAIRTLPVISVIVVQTAQ